MQFELTVLFAVIFTANSLKLNNNEDINKKCKVDYNFWAVFDLYLKSSTKLIAYSLTYDNGNYYEKEFIDNFLKHFSENVPVRLNHYLLNKTEKPLQNNVKKYPILEEVELNLKNDTFKPVSTSTNIIIFSPDPRALITSLKGNRNKTFYRKMMLLIFFEKNFNEHDLTVLIKKYWSKRIKILTVASFAPCSDSHSNFVYINDPFYLRNKKLGAIKKLSLESVLKRRLSIENSVKNLNGYKMKIVMFERSLSAYQFDNNHNRYLGLDGMFIDTLSNKMNFTPVYVKPIGDDFGDIFENGTISGALFDVIEGKAEIGGNSRFLMATDKVDFTQSPSFEPICAVVPKSHQIGYGFRIFECFKSEIWLILSITLIVCSVLFYVMTKIRCGKGDLIKCVALTFGVAVNLNKKSRHLIVMIFLLINIIFGNLLQSNLINMYSAKLYETEIDTVDDLVKSNLPLVTNLKIVMEDQTETMKNLRKKLVTNPKHSNRFQNMCLDKNFSTLDREPNIQLNLLTMRLEGKEPCLHQVKECLANFAMSYVLQKSSPYLTEVNLLIYSLAETGFLKLWKDKSFSWYVKNTTREANEFQPLRLEHLGLGWCILFFGYFIAFIAFLCEIITKRINSG